MCRSRRSALPTPCSSGATCSRCASSRCAGPPSVSTPTCWPTGGSTGSRPRGPRRERMLVAVGPSPGSERLIRATKRIAEGMHATWTAAHVELLGAPPLGDKDRERVENHLRLAESLGAEVARLAGVSVADALLVHAREHNVTRIVAGKPTHAAVARPPAREPARYPDPRLGHDRDPRDRAARGRSPSRLRASCARARLPGRTCGRRSRSAWSRPWASRCSPSRRSPTSRCCT